MNISTKAIVTALLCLGTAVSLYATATCKVKTPGDCTPVSAGTTVQACTVGTNPAGSITSADQLDLCADGSPGNDDCTYTGGNRDCDYVCTWKDAANTTHTTTQTLNQPSPVLSEVDCP